MVKWKFKYSKKSQKDAKKLKAAGLKDKVENILNILESNPFQKLPSYEKLIGDLKGFYSRRINIQHRIIYEVDMEKRIVKIFRMWTHYE